ncbi:3194_t:CDS:1, partial [Funneliformis geosporum]
MECVPNNPPVINNDQTESVPNMVSNNLSNFQTNDLNRIVIVETSVNNIISKIREIS